MGDRRLAAAFLAVAAALAVAMPAAAADVDFPLPGIEPGPPTQAPPPAAVPPAPVPEVTPAVTATPVPAPTAAPVRLPDGLTLRSAIRRAFLAGHIERDDYERQRLVALRAAAAVQRWRGARRAELAAVLATVERLASEGRLGASRLEQATVTLLRNLEVLARKKLPRAGERMIFAGDALVFQYFPGRGVQVHPLATFGRANALARPCQADRRRRDTVRVRRALARGAARRRGLTFGATLRVSRTPRPAGHRCRPAALRTILDRLAAIAVRRGSFAAWEYAFAYGRAPAPWISGMTQATAVQALARGADALGEQRWSVLAESALGAFEQAPPAGVRVKPPGGPRYVMYSGQPELDILNGFLQAVIGLEEHARLTRSARSQALFAAAEPVARAAVGPHDTGAWSLYARGGHESTLAYHQLVRGFLGRLCDRLHRAVYCATERRFARYEKEPPRVQPGLPRTVRAEAATTIALSLSKISRVSVIVRNRRGIALRRRLTLPRGRHTIAWTPARRGRHRVRIVAVGPEGLRSVVARRVRVRRSLREIAARRRAQVVARERSEASRRRSLAAHRRALARATRRPRAAASGPAARRAASPW